MCTPSLAPAGFLQNKLSGLLLASEHQTLGGQCQLPQEFGPQGLPALHVLALVLVQAVPRHHQLDLLVSVQLTWFHLNVQEEFNCLVCDQETAWMVYKHAAVREVHQMVYEHAVPWKTQMVYNHAAPWEVHPLEDLAEYCHQSPLVYAQEFHW